MTWRASWIWLPAQPQMDNLFVYARREFTCADVPASAPARVSGSQLYQLYVNGRYVGRGPNPADPSYYYFDVHELAPFLRRGQNVIALIGYCYTEKATGIIGQNWGIGGLIFELTMGNQVIASDASWKVLQAPPWDQSADVNCTLFNDFKEYYDTRKEIPGWMEAGFDDRAWKIPHVIGTPPVAPWTTLNEREIPFLGGETVLPVEAYWDSASVTYAWRDDWEFYHEMRLVKDGPRPEGKFTEVKKTRPDFTPSLLLDFGTLVTGYLEITIHDSAGGVIDLLYGESLSLARVDRFILTNGAQILKPFQRRTFRYLRLVFPEVPTRIDIDAVVLHMDTFPVEPKGAFRCSDETLNTIWEVSAHTIHMSMLDHFVDCPWRERTIYGGDVYTENIIAHYAFGDPRLNRKTLRQMFALQYAEGALPPYGPYRGVHGFYPSWTAFFGLAFTDHWQLTGDRHFLDELWPRFARLCDWTVGETQRNALAMIGTPVPGEGGDFTQWMAARKGAYHPWENFPFLVMLRQGAAIAGSIGRTQEQARWSAAVARMTTAISEHLVDAESGLVGPSDRQAAQTRGQYDGALLLWSGMPTRHGAHELAHRLLTPGAVAGIDSPMHGFFLLDGLFAIGEGTAAVEFTRKYWGEMIRRGATTFWEHFNLDSRPRSQFSHGLSACHGWSAAPAYTFGAHILGVQPLEPGFARILIAPVPSDLSWASGRVPTPHGPVTVAWQRTATTFQLSCETPRPARLVIPWPNTHLLDVQVDGKAVIPVHAGSRSVLELTHGMHQVVVGPK